jgi:transcriptional regulator with XRE-family HTH domain
LAAARQRANMTQVELARRLGKPQSVVSGYEAGKRRVDVVEFLLIVRTLGADPVEIFAEILRSLPK